MKINYDNISNKYNENINNLRDQSKQINELLQKNSELELLNSDLKNENNNFSIEKKI